MECIVCIIKKIALFLAIVGVGLLIAISLLVESRDLGLLEAPAPENPPPPIQYERAQSQSAPIELPKGIKMTGYDWTGDGLRIKMRDMTDDDIAETIVIVNRQSGETTIVKESKK